MAAKQIPLNKILPAIDRKDRDFYDNLDDDYKKGFSPFLMVRYCANVEADSELENYYIQSTNIHVNKNMFDISKHPKLQWLALTAVSPNLGDMNHTWIKQKKKVKLTTATSNAKKQLMKYFPNMKEDEIELMSKLVSKKELKEYAKAHGES